MHVLISNWATSILSIVFYSWTSTFFMVSEQASYFLYRVSDPRDPILQHMIFLARPHQLSSSTQLEHQPTCMQRRKRIRKKLYILTTICDRCLKAYAIFVKRRRSTYMLQEFFPSVFSWFSSFFTLAISCNNSFFFRTNHNNENATHSWK